MMKCSLKLIILLLVISHSYCESDEKDHQHSLQKRGLFYPWLLFSLNAATGILVAIAVPVHGLDSRNVFVSYNFEANYNMPNIPSDSYPGPIKRLKLGSTYENTDPQPDATIDDIVARNFGEKNESLVIDNPLKGAINSSSDVVTENTTIVNERSSRDINDDGNILDKMVLTRKGVYRVLESRINANFIDGKKCLLRAICESAQHPFLLSNGILGHILHIILTPSTSIDENLPIEYMRAEKLGQQSDCQKYIDRCGVSLLDSISTFTHVN